jgi:hypothetical protein
LFWGLVPKYPVSYRQAEANSLHSLLEGRADPCGAFSSILRLTNFVLTRSAHALEDAWRRVELSKAPWASEDYSTAGRIILAQHIIAMAKGGERNAKWLSDSAILYFRNKN